MTERFSLKDHLFNQSKVEYLADLLSVADATFKRDEFINVVMSMLPVLELKDRIRLISAVLKDYLPEEYDRAVRIILASLPAPLDESKTDDDFGDFIFAPFGEYIATYGCTRERLVVSLEALKEVTKRFSMEDAIRYFLRAFPREVLQVMTVWAMDDNYHVRRLVSEGTRPLLPWSGRIPLLSRDTLPLLTMLHADKTRYVMRSVAIHLNDIAKTEPQLVIDTLREWQNLGKQDARELAWMTKHALRTLVKQGHREAIVLLGYTATEFSVTTFSIEKPLVKGGDEITLSATITTATTAPLLVDYVIHFVKKNGSTTPKVFKWKTLTLKAGETITLTKRHWLKIDATTFTLYPGRHTVELQINGVIVGATTFILEI